MHPTRSDNIKPARLITIPVSHYCEKARWALTRSQIPFVEERHMPPFHRFATRGLGERSANGQAPETEKNLSPLNRWVVQRVGGQSVPVLVTETGVLKSSEEILRYVDAIASDEAKLYSANAEDRKQAEDLVKKFDMILAPAVRQWFYCYTFDQPQLIQTLWCEGVPWYERLLFPIVFRWMSSNVMQMYAINATTAAKTLEIITQEFKFVETLLRDGRQYLLGNQFSAADLTFATLAAAMVQPSGYGVTLPELNQLPAEMAAKIQVLRETLAGKFVLRLYQEHSG